MKPTVVIGAGPYGLSTAAHVKDRGVPVRVFGAIMSSWRDTMPRGMVLKSTPYASTISAPRPGHTIQDFCDVIGRRRLETVRDLVPIDLFTRYGEWFARELVPEVEDAQVVRVEQADGAFRATLDSGEEVAASSVVVASGLNRFAHVPSVLCSLTPGGPAVSGPVSHSSHHADLSLLAGREVVVVGAGQSALESAVLLREAGATVRLLARRPGAVRFGTPPRDGLHWQPDTPLGRSWALLALSHAPGPEVFRHAPEAARLWVVHKALGPRGAWWLRDRFAGMIPVIQGRSLAGARLEGDKVVLTTRGADGRTQELTADHVIAATGYRVNLEELDFLGPQLRARLRRTGTSPLLDSGYCSSVPGLYFTGLPSSATFGPLMRFVCGTQFASPRLAAALAGAGSRQGRTAA